MFSQCGKFKYRLSSYLSRPSRLTGESRHPALRPACSDQQQTLEHLKQQSDGRYMPPEAQVSNALESRFNVLEVIVAS